MLTFIPGPSIKDLGSKNTGMIGKLRIHFDAKTQIQIIRKNSMKNTERLAKNFNYSYIDFFFFELFQYRSKISNIVKQNGLKNYSSIYFFIVQKG